MKTKMMTCAGALILALAAPTVLADSGSDLFNAKVAQLQQELRIRNVLADEAIQFQLARGYTYPESIAWLRSSRTMLANADDSAFGREMNNLRETMVLYAFIDDNAY